MKFLLVLILIAGCSKVWCQEPLSFKGLQLGASSEQQMLEQYPDARCSGDKTRSCIVLESRESQRVISVDCLSATKLDWAACTKTILPPRLSVGGAYVESISFTFYDGRLGKIFMSPRSASFESSSRAMMDAYGRPQTDTVTPITNLAGAILEDRLMTWNRPGGSITLRRYSGNVNESSVLYLSTEGQARAAEEAEARRRRAAGDL